MNLGASYCQVVFVVVERRWNLTSPLPSEVGLKSFTVYSSTSFSVDNPSELWTRLWRLWKETMTWWAALIIQWYDLKCNLGIGNECFALIKGVSVKSGLCVLTLGYLKSNFPGILSNLRRDCGRIFKLLLVAISRFLPTSLSKVHLPFFPWFQRSTQSWSYWRSLII